MKTSAPAIKNAIDFRVFGFASGARGRPAAYTQEKVVWKGSGGWSSHWFEPGSGFATM
jgi:hypothetical protein